MYGANPQKEKKLEEKIRQKVEKYNKKALKWKFSPITFNYATGYPSHFNVTSDYEEPSNFWQMIVFSYRYGYLEGDWEKIFALSKKLRQMRRH